MLVAFHPEGLTEAHLGNWVGFFYALLTVWHSLCYCLCLKVKAFRVADYHLEHHKLEPISYQWANQ